MLKIFISETLLLLCAQVLKISSSRQCCSLSGVQGEEGALEAAGVAAGAAAVARVLLCGSSAYAELPPHGREPHLQADPLGQQCGVLPRMGGEPNWLPVDRCHHGAAAPHWLDAPPRTPLRGAPGQPL